MWGNCALIRGTHRLFPFSFCRTTPAAHTFQANPARLFAAGRVRFRGHIDILVRGERIFTHERQR